MRVGHVRRERVAGELEDGDDERDDGEEEIVKV